MGIWPGLVVCFILLLTFRDGLRPWIGWHAIHHAFPQVIRKPVSEQSPYLQRITMVVYWIYISNAFAFAAILVSGEDVRKTYRAAWDSFMDTFFRSTPVRTDSPRWLYSTAYNQSTIMPPAVSSYDLSRVEC
jgi:fatty-acid desaturase